MSDDLEKIKEQKMQQMQGQQQGQQQQEEQLRKQMKQLASEILTDEAQSRLGNLRAAKPELASQIEAQLVQLHRAGQIRDEITDEQLKDLLKKVQESDEERNIKYR